MERLIDLLQQFRPQDLIDILLLSVVIYLLLMLIKGTRTIPILLGLSVLLGVYGLASFLALDVTGWLMDNLLSSVVVILVVLFQADLRNALARLGMTTMFREGGVEARLGLIDEVVETALALGEKRIGATIVLEHESGLRNYIERGRVLNAVPSRELMMAIFHTTSPLHDGAVIITNKGELAAARCILPLTSSLLGSSSLGTRHRSAVGLSEETDAVVVVVSEERGMVSLAFQGRLLMNLEERELRSQITQILRTTEASDAVAETGSTIQTAEG